MKSGNAVSTPTQAQKLLYDGTFRAAPRMNIRLSRRPDKGRPPRSRQTFAGTSMRTTGRPIMPKMPGLGGKETVALIGFSQSLIEVVQHFMPSQSAHGSPRGIWIGNCSYLILITEEWDTRQANRKSRRQDRQRYRAGRVQAVVIRGEGPGRTALVDLDRVGTDGRTDGRDVFDAPQEITRTGSAV